MTVEYKPGLIVVLKPGVFKSPRSKALEHHAWLIYAKDENASILAAPITSDKTGRRNRHPEDYFDLPEDSSIINSKNKSFIKLNASTKLKPADILQWTGLIPKELLKEFIKAKQAYTRNVELVENIGSAPWWYI